MARGRGRPLPADGLRRCRACGEDRDDVVGGNRHNPGFCPACLTTLLSEWSGHMSPSAEARWRSKYGIDSGTHALMFAKQGGVCAICGDDGRSVKTDAPMSGLVVDHCHDTGKVRGLLCSRCNTAIGLLGDNPQWLRRAAAYVNGRGGRTKVRRPDGETAEFLADSSQ